MSTSKSKGGNHGVKRRAMGSSQPSCPYVGTCVLHKWGVKICDNEKGTTGQVLLIDAPTGIAEDLLAEARQLKYEYASSIKMVDAYSSSSNAPSGVCGAPGRANDRKRKELTKLLQTAHIVVVFIQRDIDGLVRQLDEVQPQFEKLNDHVPGACLWVCHRKQQKNQTKKPRRDQGTSSKTKKKTNIVGETKLDSNNNSDESQQQIEELPPPSPVSGNLVRDTCLPRGLVDSKICSVDSEWSSMKFTRKHNTKNYVR